jgi:hypothetical protein
MVSKTGEATAYFCYMMGGTIISLSSGVFVVFTTDARLVLN